MAHVWHSLVPEQVSVQVLGRLAKLHTGLMALFLLYLCITHCYRSLGKLAGSAAACSASFLAELVADLPEQILPARRKCQQYIINPNLKLRLQDRWVGIHEMLPLVDLGVGSTTVNESIPKRNGSCVRIWKRRAR